MKSLMVKVIGKKPVLRPGEQHNYSSGCLLSPYGAMKGHFNMINFTTET
jgi:ApaG protein